MPDEVRTPLIVSRPLLLAWCLWLLASWVANLAAYSPQRSWVTEIDGLDHWRVPADAFIPIARSMMISIALSIGLVWPAWRLSLSGPEPIGRTISDGVSLWAVAQVVVWPLRVLVGLSLADLALISLTLLNVTALAGVCVNIGRRGGPLLRGATMVICAAGLMGPWLVAYLGGGRDADRLSPLWALWWLSAGGVSARAVSGSLLMVAILIAAVASWRIIRKAEPAQAPTA